MHEMALAESVINIIEDQAKAQKFERVKIIWLEIGQLSHVDPDAIIFCFSAVSKGTIADAAELEIIRTPGKSWCHDCSATVDVSSLIDPCPTCGGYKLQVSEGEEMRVRELEVD